MEKKRFFDAKLAALVVAVSFGVHLGVLFNGFVYDEVGLILKNPLIRDISNIPEVFSGDIWKFTGYVGGSYYRPIVHLIYMADYHIFGLNPWGYHLSKLLLHVGSSLLVFLIASGIMSRSPWAANSTRNPQAYIPFAAALFFSTHPVHTECVTIATAEVSFALFFLLSFYLYLRADGRWGMGLIASTLFFFLAMLSKETALMLPVLLFAYDHTFKRDITLNLSKKTIYLLVKRYLPYLVATGLYFALRTYALWGISTFKAHPELGAWGYLINVFPLFAGYLGKLILPVNLNVAYVLHPVTSVLEWKTLLSIAVTLGFIAAVYVARNRNRVVFFGLLWIAVPLLPALYIPALGDHVFAERYLYLPSVGFVIIVATGLSAVTGLGSLGRWAASVMLSMVFIITALYSAGTITRIPVWKDNLTLWSDTVKKSPDSHIVHLNLGVAYKEAGQLDEAVREYKNALEIKPDYGAAHNNLGIIHYLQGRMDEAAREYRKALELNPALAIAYNNLGVIYFKQGRIKEAAGEYKEALRLNPALSEAHENLGVAYKELGLMDEAAKEFKEVLRLNPESTRAHENLAKAYYDKGELDRAMEEYRLALTLEPALAEVHYALGIILYRKGNPAEAIKELKEAIRIDPGFSKPHFNLAIIYDDMGLLDEALKWYAKTVELDPDNYKAYNNMGIIYGRNRDYEKAIDLFKKALEIRPDDKEALKNLSLAREKLRGE